MSTLAWETQQTRKRIKMLLKKYARLEAKLYKPDAASV